MTLAIGVEEVELPGLDGKPVKVRRFTNEQIRSTFTDALAMVPEGDTGAVVIATDLAEKEAKLVFAYKNGHWSMAVDGGYDWGDDQWFGRAAARYTWGSK